MQNRLVSIITPVYNGARFMRYTIDSVLAQTYQDWEMWIVDDGSKDSSADIARSYACQDERIHVLQQANAGSAAARNNGIRHAQGRYIVLLDSDDVWEPSFLEDQLRFMQETPGALLICSAHKRIDENGNEFKVPFFPPKVIRRKDLLKTNSISCLTGVYDSSAFGKFYLREDFRSLRDDHVYWLDILKKVEVAYGNQQVLASYRLSQFAVTHNKLKMIRPQFKVYREYEHMGWLKSCYYLCCWAINGIKKHHS
jgi:glycosyltransferase involved in cell wall biosynthesis